MYKNQIKLKKTIPDKEQVRQMVTALEGILPMTREQIVFRAIEKYYHHHTDVLRTSDNRGRIKKVLLESQHYGCMYCPAILTQKTATIDHKLPRARGGESNIENLCATCNKCNSNKGDLTEEEFRKILGLPKLSPSISTTIPQTEFDLF